MSTLMCLQYVIRIIAAKGGRQIYGQGHFGYGFLQAGLNPLVIIQEENISIGNIMQLTWLSRLMTISRSLLAQLLFTHITIHAHCG